MAKEQFFHPESADLLKTLDEAAHRSGLSRGQAFDDFLHMVVCSLSGGRMEQQYLEVVKRHSRGKPGKRGNAFELGGYLWLNDSTCPDGAQEYAVLKRDGGNGKPVQIESITFGWCDEAKALEYIRHTLAGNDDRNSFRSEVDPVLQSPVEHGRCLHCA